LTKTIASFENFKTTNRLLHFCKPKNPNPQAEGSHLAPYYLQHVGVVPTRLFKAGMIIMLSQPSLGL